MFPAVKSCDYEVKYTYPKLGERNISASYFPIRGPLGIDRIACVLRDITERKRAERRHCARAKKSSAAFSGTQESVWSSSRPKDDFSLRTKHTATASATKRKSFKRKTVESVTLSEDWPAFSNKLREALTEGRGFQWFEKRCLHKSGRIVYTASSTSLIRSHNGEPQYFVGEILDVTMPKRQNKLLRI